MNSMFGFHFCEIKKDTRHGRLTKNFGENINVISFARCQGNSYNMLARQTEKKLTAKAV